MDNAIVTSFRLTPEARGELEALCRQFGRNQSDTIRLLIKSAVVLLEQKPDEVVESGRATWLTPPPP